MGISIHQASSKCKHKTSQNFSSRHWQKNQHEYIKLKAKSQNNICDPYDHLQAASGDLNAPDESRG